MRWMVVMFVGLAMLGLAWGSVKYVPTANSSGVPEPVLSHELPHEVDLALKMPEQMDFDVFSWKSFVALNWPAKADGTPNTAVKIGQDTQAKRVWEHYMDPIDVFLADGSKPAWNAPQPIGKGLSMLKGDGKVKLANLDALHFPVVDQDKNFIVFGIRLNKEEFDYIVNNGLYNKQGQSSPTPGAEKYIKFPSGVKGGIVGAVEIKTAWRLFPSESKPDPDVLKRYFITEAGITVPIENSGTGKELRITATLGLVGFHIAHKTTGFPQWVWSTFEHVDNLDGKKPTFRDPNCDEKACPPNNRPIPPRDPIPEQPDQPDVAPVKPYLWADTPPFASPNQRVPVQVKRLTKIDDATVKLNEAWQKALRDVNPASVWQYYQLISTQWPTKPFTRQPGQQPGAGGNNPSVKQYEGSPLPTILANIPIETYNQQTSSCMVCHSKAFTIRGDYADFSFLLQLAK